MDRWEQVKQVFQAALERKPEERHAFLAEACGDDDALRREVTALLDSHEDSDGFLERHPLQDVSDPDSYSASESDPGESETSAGPERSVKATADDLVDKIIDGKYRIERCLGAGGMGAVYLVRHLSLNRYFALKLIRSSFEGSRPFLERFRNEARALGKLKHPNIVEVTDYGVDPPDEGSPYLVMEYLEGTTLDEMSRKTDGLPIENALTVLEQVAGAIDYAHEQGVLHRDLKPVNVFISDAEGGKGCVKILDFGVAKLLPQEESPPLLDEGIQTPARPSTRDAGRTEISGLLTERGTLTGTPTYIAPEIIKGHGATRASDIYSFGVLIYATLVGRPPYTGTPLEILRAHIDSEPRKPSTIRESLPPELDPAILAPLEKDPDERPKNAADVVRGLRLGYRDASRRSV